MFVSKKRMQLALKVLLIASVIGVYFIVLLRETFAAWESTSTPSILSTSDALAKVKNGIADQVINFIVFECLLFLFLSLCVSCSLHSIGKWIL